MNTIAPTSSPTLTSAEAADYINVSGSWLNQSRMTSSTQVDAPPFVRFGRNVRYLRADLDQWLNDHRVHPAPRPADGGDQK